MNIETVKGSIRSVFDFPKEGIHFRDITTLLKETEYFNYVVDVLYEKYKDKGITKIVCLESRGFILGGALAYKLNAGFVPIRKPGKLPAEHYTKKYDLEYGTDEIQIHKDAFEDNEVVLLHDDLLATGGTALASLDLLSNFNLKKIYVNFLIELNPLKGRDKFNEEMDIYSLFKFD
ncbi:MAG: adenine phosphoribosyltransferase [Bacteroidales bacterium]|jgi:adenine phosphoribosyltransferase|nr:adenine phosphoribosyltransferase [Bacteroidales bacterium]